jgi:hypothetical protein
MTQRAGDPIEFTTGAAIAEVSIPAGTEYLWVSVAGFSEIRFHVGPAGDPPSPSAFMFLINANQPLVLHVPGVESFYHSDSSLSAGVDACAVPLVGYGSGMSPLPPLRIVMNPFNIGTAVDIAQALSGRPSNHILATCAGGSADHAIVTANQSAGAPGSYKAIVPAGASMLFSTVGHSHFHFGSLGGGTTTLGWVLVDTMDRGAR